MSEESAAAPIRPGKAAAAFRTIGEVADELDLPAHVLRFWESKFPQLRPMKRGGGRRYYRPEDIDLLRRIRQCLYQEGYTIRGVQKLLGDAAAGGAEPPSDNATPALFTFDAPPQPDGRARRRTRPLPADTRAALEALRRDLLEARAALAELMRRPKPP